MSSNITFSFCPRNSDPVKNISMGVPLKLMSSPIDFNETIRALTARCVLCYDKAMVLGQINLSYPEGYLFQVIQSWSSRWPI